MAGAHGLSPFGPGTRAAPLLSPLGPARPSPPPFWGARLAGGPAAGHRDSGALGERNSGIAELQDSGTQVKRGSHRAPSPGRAALTAVGGAAPPGMGGPSERPRKLKQL